MCVVNLSRESSTDGIRDNVMRPLKATCTHCAKKMENAGSVSGICWTKRKDARNWVRMLTTELLDPLVTCIGRKIRLPGVRQHAPKISEILIGRWICENVQLNEKGQMCWCMIENSKENSFKMWEIKNETMGERNLIFWTEKTLHRTQFSYNPKNWVAVPSI